MISTAMSHSRDDSCGSSTHNSSASSFVAGISLPPNANNGNDDAVSLLQIARPDGYDFCITPLPLFPTHNKFANLGALISSSVSPSHPRPRRDVTNLDSKWWSTSIVGEIPPISFTDDPLEETDERMSTTPDDAVADIENANSKRRELKLVESLVSSSSVTRKVAEQTFTLMLRWAAHMSIPAVILPASPPPSERRILAAYARLLASLTAEASASNVQLWLRVPFDPQSLAAFDTLYHSADMPANLGCLVCFSSRTESDANSPLAAATLHKFIGCNTRAVSFDTNVFLTNKRGYPTLSKSHQILFTTLVKRLGKTLRVIVEGGQRHFPPPSLTVEVGGGGPNNSPSSPNSTTGCLAYLQYLRHLRARPEVVATLDTPEAAMETSYLDQLQSPLQPLADDLEFCTYETFEKDPVKYRHYQTAIEHCLQDMMRHGLLQRAKFEQTQDSSSTFQGGRYHCTHTVSILVVGAGRGPLVRSALLAVEAVNARFIEQHQSSSTQKQPHIIHPRLIALEKNLNAVLFLRSLRKYGGDMWEGKDITIVHADIRNITPAVVSSMRTDSSGEPIDNSVDIMVSELLGSFGDNELSPECLQAACRSGFLKDHGVCIPQSYQSYVAPISSMRLHAEARAQAYTPTRATDGPGGQPFGMLRAMETPYVVRPYAASQIFMEKPCFEFRHEVCANTSAGTLNSPAPAVIDDNDQFKTLEFRADLISAGSGCGYGPSDTSILSQTSTGVIQTSFKTGISIHGLLGTFEAVLYQSNDNGTSNPPPPVMISIAPSNFSTGMFSWFPLYFPLKEPIHVPYDATLRVNIWRRGDSSRVWYEWCSEVVLLPGNAEVLLATSGIHNPNGRSYFVSL